MENVLWILYYFLIRFKKDTQLKKNFHSLNFSSLLNTKW